MMYGNYLALNLLVGAGGTHRGIVGWIRRAAWGRGGRWELERAASTDPPGGTPCSLDAPRLSTLRGGG